MFRIPPVPGVTFYVLLCEFPFNSFQTPQNWRVVRMPSRFYPWCACKMFSKSIKSAFVKSTQIGNLMWYDIDVVGTSTPRSMKWNGLGMNIWEVSSSKMLFWEPQIHEGNTKVSVNFTRRRLCGYTRFNGSSTGDPFRTHFVTYLWN
jgi:hypothetical protein